MKKSEIYKMAQMSVIHDTRLTDANKLEVIRELQDKESTALFIEKKEEEERNEEDVRS